MQSKRYPGTVIIDYSPNDHLIYKMSRAQIDTFELFIFVKPTVQNPKTLHLLSYMTNKSSKPRTYKEQEPINDWQFRLKNDSRCSKLLLFSFYVSFSQLID